MLSRRRAVPREPVGAGYCTIEIRDSCLCLRDTDFEALPRGTFICIPSFIKA